ncbi:MAG: branched-chain amino acid ABC transporter permease [Thiomonas sp.]|uniref:branched-chain amino acid ABC transporter permease n=1 Tax=Thiomonas sp. TaxID=2047785 RepID=UPI002A36DBDA|nr:branched-chain amino acid ABC transporter permease [Thiomonas sp.]MDY0329942.1 branched-chain amino acid ABC transporter permease [Thiomonas sp.]
MTASPALRRGRAALFPALIVLPLILPLSSASFSLLSQLACAWLLLLSVGLLAERAGLLSFGQAMYAGLAAYAAAHAMNAIAAAGWPLPFALVPLYGGAFAVAVALVFGPLSVRRGGLSFAMITLGLGLLVALAAPMLQGFFGGEGGVSADRTAGPAWLGLNLLSQRQVYGVSAAYVLLGAALLRWLDGARLDSLARAVRDNPLRVAVSGVDPRHVRLYLLLVSAFLAGVSGALQTLHFEQVSAGALGLPSSSMALLFSLAAGSGTAWGALLGAGLMVGSESVLATVSRAWMLYVGLGFLAIVIWAPQGLSTVLCDITHRLRERRDPDLLWGLAALLLCGAVSVIGASSLIELLYAVRQQLLAGDTLWLYGLPLHASSADVWMGAALLTATGAGLGAVVWRTLAPQWRDDDARA